MPVPLIGALAAGGGTLGTALSIAGTVGTGVMIKQGHDAKVQAEEQMEEQKRLQKQQMAFEKQQQEKQLKAQQELQKQQEKHELEIAKLQNKNNKNLQKMNNNISNQVSISSPQNDISLAEKGFSNKSKIFLKRKTKKFAAGGFFKGAWEVAQNVGRMAWNNKGKFATDIGMGVGIAVPSVVAGTIIVNKMKNDGIDVNAMKRDIEMQKQLQQKQMSSPADKHPGVLKSAAKGIPGGMIFGSLMAVPSAMSYGKDAETLKALYGTETQQNYSLSKTTIKLKRKCPKQKQFSFGRSVGFTKGGFRWDPHSFKKNPLQTILGVASSFAMAGGNAGMNKFTNGLINMGKKYGSDATVRAGNWLREHPKTTLAGSIPVGMGIMKATFDTGEKIGNKIGGAISPDYKVYQEWKELHG